MCRRRYRNLSPHLYFKHKVDPQEYKEEYEVQHVVAEALRRQDAERRTIWPRERVAEELRKRWRERQPLNMRALTATVEGGRLYAAASGRFGSYKAAIRAAGIDYDKICKAPVWSRSKVVEALRACKARGLPLHDNAVSRSNSALYNAARKWFGAYKKAIRAAGFDYARVRKR